MVENRWISSLHWRRVGQQSRSEKTQSALMDAAEDLILEKGTEATSIADIAERAGYSVGSVYHHFKDKKALYFALFHRMTQAYAALNEEAANPELWQGATIGDILQGYMAITLRTAREKGAAKAAVSAVVADHPELAEHYAQIQAATRRTLLSLLLERADEIGRDDAAHAAAFLIDQLAAMLRARLDRSSQPASLLDQSDAEFVEDALSFATSYLRLTPQEPKAPDSQG